MITDFHILYDVIMTSILLIILFFSLTRPKLPDIPITIGYIIAIVTILLFGLAPATVEVGTDRLTYEDMFINANQYIKDGFRDITFIRYAKYCYEITGSSTGCFLISAAIYVLSYVFFYKNSCSSKYVYILIIASLALGYTGYHYNTLRAGLAIAFALVAISKNQHKYTTVIFSILAIGMHITALLIIICYYATTKLQNTKTLYYLWGITFFALIVGIFNSLEPITSQLSIGEDNRFIGYIDGDSEIYKAGLRLDFIVYSLIPIIIGWYYIYKMKYSEKYYIHIYNTYILSNTIWLIFNKIPYTDRVAYLSWIFIPFILIYPICNDVNGVIKHKKLIYVGCATIVIGVNFYLKYIR